MDEILKKELENSIKDLFASDSNAIAQMMCHSDLDEEEQLRLLEIIEKAEGG